MSDAEVVARWLHEEAREYTNERTDDPNLILGPWEELEKKTIARYKHVAKLLLTNPPEALRPKKAHEKQR